MKPQKTLIAFGLAFWMVVSLACGLSARTATPVPTDTPTPTSTPTETTVTDCTTQTEPTEQDIQYLLGFPGDSLASAEWERSYQVKNMVASATWMNNTKGAMVDVEMLIFSCGYTQNNVDTYFSEKNLTEVILRDYQPVFTSKCKDVTGRLELFEFNATLHEQPYLVRLWIQPVNDTRLLSAILTYPEVSKGEFDQVSQELFSSLHSCGR